jgi:hypothetical protein
MSNKKETPVSWLFEEMQKTYIFNQDDFDMFKKALQMETKKQQKYDEMLAMLEELVKSNPLHEGYHFTKLKAYQLIKEAKEL